MASNYKYKPSDAQKAAWEEPNVALGEAQAPRMQSALGASALTQGQQRNGTITQSYYTKPLSQGKFDENGRPIYTQSDAVSDAAQNVANQEKNKPGDYQSNYNDQIQGLIDKLLNRDPFQYDFAADPMYQQYADKYQQQGQMAMKSSMGEAAALTGGYGNSYAQGVGQQSYQQHLQGLNDMIPEL
ncbi:MAG: hypothetical protein RSG96_09045, partial [Clostridia bacterium]